MSTSKSTPTPAKADLLRAKGWTLRPAAKLLGVNHVHLHYVLNGSRPSASLLRRIESLPTKSTNPA